MSTPPGLSQTRSTARTIPSMSSRSPPPHLAPASAGSFARAVSHRSSQMFTTTNPSVSSASSNSTFAMHSSGLDNRMPAHSAVLAGANGATRRREHDERARRFPHPALHAPAAVLDICFTAHPSDACNGLPVRLLSVRIPTTQISFILGSHAAL